VAWYQPPPGRSQVKRINLPRVTQTLTDLVTVCAPHFVSDPVDSGQSIVKGQSREAPSDLGTSPAIHAQNVIERGWAMASPTSNWALWRRSDLATPGRGAPQPARAEGWNASPRLSADFLL
jgi:hypothetical protein